jgi:hypothetical protein
MEVIVGIVTAVTIVLIFVIVVMVFVGDFEFIKIFRKGGKK